MFEFVRRLSGFLLLAAALAAPAWAADKSRNERREPPRTLSDSVRQVERDTGGRVVGADRVRRGDRDVHRVKVLTPEGRMQVIHQDPRQSRRERGRSEPERRPREED